MKYRVVVTRAAEKELRAVPRKIQDRVAVRLSGLESDPRPHGSRKLKGQEAYRLRVGDYRVLYTVDESARQVTVSAIGHRRDVYR